MLNRSRRLVVLAALMAMAALVAAVPVHHAHMLHMALADGAERSTTAVHDKADCHHGDTRHDHADHLEFEMPRCPVCSTVQMAALQLPVLAPLQLLLPERSPERIETAAAAIPRAGHFRPVQPRAPPIAA